MDQKQGVVALTWDIFSSEQALAVINQSETSVQASALLLALSLVFLMWFSVRLRDTSKQVTKGNGPVHKVNKAVQ